jgi:hypothetical protein
MERNPFSCASFGFAYVLRTGGPCKVRREGQWQKMGAVPLKEEVPLKEGQTRRVGAVRFTQQHDTL